ncbi:two-component response regulator-like APRR2 isoform X2 [Vicia villosa]|uniref:two-component response regulator-like APRR2 isoform X2 n=1 Tax=Vicia villosa TaxID=3911 RepID=UPI00273CD942|nr:two-component response regulator-like APRR2 isoform X2 [Vicia villosa]
MVCTANDLQQWKDFPKGLKVLLLQEDTACADEIRTKLEAMDYIVSIFCDVNEALSAISNRPEGFHIAIVEVSSHSCEGGFKFLENTKDLPTIIFDTVTSNNDCLNTMMKCIALGAVEFLSKPLSEDKLRNIWQHVVHKAFNAGASVKSESLKPVKESVVSILQLQTDNEQHESSASVELEKVSGFSDNDPEHYPAPSTPQLKQLERLLDDGDCQEQTNCSMDKESGEHDGESKSVETTCENLNAESIRQDQTNCSMEKESGEHDEESKSVEITCENLNAESTRQEQTNCPTDKESGEHDGESKSVEITCKNLNAESTRKSEVTLVQNEEEDFMDTSKCESVVTPHPQTVKVLTNTESNTTSANKVGIRNHKCEIKANRKKMKVDWTPELHKKFVKAVEQLGIDHAIPSRILDLMKVDSLTRHNVASHLQKYRMHKRHILPKQEDRKWLYQRDPMQRGYCFQRPIMPCPPSYYSNHALPQAPLYPMWGQSGSQMAGMPIWGPSSYPVWQPTESWHWQPFPGMHSDAWGCPVLPPPQAQCFSYTQNIPALSNDNNVMDYTFSTPNSSLDDYPEEAIIDKVVTEAMSKPWLPLPIGLKPPSTDSVLTELSRKGISSIPPSNNSCIPI